MSLLIAYLVGFVVVAIVADEPWPGRFVLAMLWPLSVALFAITAGLLLLALPLARPFAGAAVLLALILLGWLGWRAG
jgi:hypothetical protein